MKRLLTVLLLLTSAAFAQGVRIGDGTPVASTLNLSGVGNILTPSSTAAIAICTYPANAVPCTNKATTYTTQALSVACATSVQVTLPGTSSCVANADSLGNWGAWVANGTYDYTITVGSHSYGPYTVSASPTPSSVPFAASAGKDAIQDLGFVNAISQCGLQGAQGAGTCTTANTSGCRDEFTLMQACIDNNQGQKLFLPKLNAATSVDPDYYFSQKLTLKGRGTWLEAGGGKPRWFYGTIIKRPTGVGGILLDSTCFNCTLKNMTWEGSDSFEATDIRTWEDWTAETNFRGTSSLDGVQIAAGSAPTLEDVASDLSKGNGFQFIGQGAGGQPDLGKFSGLMTRNNRAYGIYTWGADANVATFSNLNSLTDGLGAVSDNAFYGNTFIDPHNSGSGAPWTVAAGANKAITAATGLTVASNVLTISTDVPNTWAANTWVTTTGSTDATFNGTCKLLTVGTSTATCNFTHADGSTGGGTAATSTGVQIRAYYAAHSITLQAYKSTSTAGCSTFIANYAESASGTSDGSYGCALTLNPQGASVFVASTTTGQHIQSNTDGSLYLLGGNWIFKPTTIGKSFVIRNAANTNKVTIDPETGNTVIPGTLQFGGLTPGGVNYMTLPNAKGISFTNAAGNATLRGIYMHSDNNLHLGDTTGGTTVDGPFTVAGSSASALSGTLGVTGVSTLTGGMKAGASGSTISDSRELVQNAHSCGTTTTCANTANGSNRIIFGTVALSSGTPSTATVASITAFTSTSSYVCVLTNMTNAANNLLKVVNTSTTSFTITGPNTVTDTIAYQCIGN